MVRLLGLPRGDNESPREINRIPSESGESGWLIRFFDSEFFCEWIAVSYLYKHDHPGVRDYLCNRMYTLPLEGIESYLFQICYMLVHKPSPSLDRFVIDICSKSLHIALKVHWFLMAELEDVDDNEGIGRVQDKCQIAATLMGEWPLLIRPQNPSWTPGNNAKSRVINKILSSKQKLLSLASPPQIPQRSASFSPGSGSTTSQEENDGDSSMNVFKKLMPGQKVRDALLLRKSAEKDDNDVDRPKGRDSEQDGFLKRILKELKEDEDRGVRSGASSEGFFKRLFHDRSENDEKGGPKQEEEEKNAKDEKEGLFFKRLFRDQNDSAEKVGAKSAEENENEGMFYKRLFRERSDSSENAGSKPQEEDEKKGLSFKRLFRDKHENDDKAGAKPADEEEKDGLFFRRLFLDRSDGDDKAGSKSDDEREGLFFKRLFRNRGDGDNKTGAKLGDDDDKEGLFFKRFFRDRSENGEKLGTKSGEEDEKENFFQRLFKEKHSDHRDKKRGDDKKDAEEQNASSCEEDEPSDFLSFRRLFRVHPEDEKSVSVDENRQAGPLNSSPGTENFFRKLFLDRDRSIEDSELLSSKKNKEKRPGSPRQQNEAIAAKPPLPINITSQIRKGTYHLSVDFVQSLCDISYGLVDVFPMEDRKISLRESLAEINTQLAAAGNSGGVCFPLRKGMFRVVHVPVEEAILLNSREKAPYMISVEVLKGECPSNSTSQVGVQKASKGIPLASGDAQFHKPPPWAYPLRSPDGLHRSGTDLMLRSASHAIDQAMTQLWEDKVKFVHVSLSVGRRSDDHETSNDGLHFNMDEIGRSLDLAIEDHQAEDEHINGEVQVHGPAQGDKRKNVSDELNWVQITLTAVPGVNMDDIVDQEPERKKDHRRVPSTVAMDQVKAAAEKGVTPPGLPLKRAGQESAETPKTSGGGVLKPTDALAGELWEEKKERIRSTSVFGKSPGWDLRSVIVKSGDDCRQEHLAVQLISHFYDLYQEAGLPLWLRPYEVLVTSSYTALIETIPDTASIHSIKNRFRNITSLRDFYVQKHQENSPSFRLAQRNFVESMAGYSIFCYLLQVKDRHNGNLLIDEEGHIIHIDFGFMLSNSPGGVNFENAPFKLTRELLEVMDSDAEGTPSEFFDYFKVLCIQGFLICQKHAERIILLVEMLQDSGFPCFKGGQRTIQNLRKRFHLTLTEEQCVSLVLSLIRNSVDAWRTRQYDYYQRVLNGIL